VISCEQPKNNWIWRFGHLENDLIHKLKEIYGVVGEVAVKCGCSLRCTASNDARSYTLSRSVKEKTIWCLLGPKISRKSGVAGQPHLTFEPSPLSKHHLVNIMATSVPTRLLFRALRATSQTNGRSAFCSIRRRSFADIAANDMTLPLMGYKVLDMTRVLAGVSAAYLILLYYC
jgi:hypothetical protein